MDTTKFRTIDRASREAAKDYSPRRKPWVAVEKAASPKGAKETKFAARCSALVLIASLAALPACSVNVKKGDNGQDKQVDINTPVGGIHVSKGADVRDVGLAVYPGARPKQKDSDDDEKSANVNISSFGFGLKVVALEYESDDSPAKLVSFYKDQLKKYGNVLECHTSGHMNMNMDMKTSGHDHGNDLTCDDKGKGNNIELKVGTKDNQHIVSVEPDGKGASFALVYVRTHGKGADI